MGRIEKSIEIEAPPDHVWELLALDRLPEWTVGLHNKVEYTSDVRRPEDKYRVKASAHTTIKGAGEIDFEITESRELEKLTYRMMGKRANKTVVTFLLESVEEGTNVAYVMTYELPGGMLGKFLGKVGKGVLEKEVIGSLAKLKNILDQEVSDYNRASIILSRVLNNANRNENRTLKRCSLHGPIDVYRREGSTAHLKGLYRLEKPVL